MAAMTTALSTISAEGTTVVYAAPTSTAARPHTVEQKRRLPSGNRTVNEAWCLVKRITEDADGNALPSPTLIEARVRYDVNGLSADLTGVKALFREFVASDEFDVLVDTQKPIAGL